MEGAIGRNWKKKVFFGVAALMCIVALVIIGYTAHYTSANQLSNGVSAPKETDMRIDMKAKNESVKPEGTTGVIGSDTAALSSNQQGETDETNSNVEVRVDGTPIDVSKDGSVHKVIKTEDGSTSIDISIQSNNSSGDSRTRSSLNVDTDSSVRIRSETRE